MHISYFEVQARESLPKFQTFLSMKSLEVMKQTGLLPNSKVPLTYKSVKFSYYVAFFKFSHLLETLPFAIYAVYVATRNQTNKKQD